MRTLTLFKIFTRFVNTRAFQQRMSLKSPFLFAALLVYIFSAYLNAQDIEDYKLELPVIDLSFPKPETPIIETPKLESEDLAPPKPSLIHIDSITNPDGSAAFKSTTPTNNEKVEISPTEAAEQKEVASTKIKPEAANIAETTQDIIPPKVSKQKSAVPAGFENLSEPQTTVVDIYLGDEYLISQLATYTPTDITFSNTDIIVAKIPALLDKELIQNLLKQPQATNSELACFYKGQDNCGTFDPEIAGVIFNENSFRVDLFISSDYLSIRSAGHRKYIPASDGDFSLLQNLSAAYAGSTSNNNSANSDTYSINSNSTFAFKENRLQVMSNFRNGGANNIDTAVIRRDWQGLEYQLGYFRSNSGNFQFMSDDPIRGIRFASSLDTREDLRQTAGNELLVFLTSRSEVLIFKDERLISSRFYDAGNQVLDTSQLPGGAYDVTIKIIGAGGSINEENRFYIKSNQLPPLDQPLYFIEAGELLNSEDVSGFASSNGTKLLRGGYNYRLSDQIGAMAGLNHTAGSSEVDSVSAFELGLTHLGKHHDVSIGGFTGSKNRRGARFNLRTRFSGIYFNANYRRIWNDNFDPFAPVIEADLLGEPNTQASVSFSSLFSFGRIEIDGRINRRAGDAIESYGARFDFPRLRLGFSELYTGIQTNREEGNTTHLFTVELRFNKKHVTSQLRPEYSSKTDSLGEKTTGVQSYGIVSWHDRDMFEDNDLRVDLRGQNIDGRSGIGTEVDFATQSGRIRVQGERFNDSNSSSSTPVGSTTTTSQSGTRFNGNGFTSFMLNKKSMKLGGKDQSQSALLVKIDGAISDASFDVIVDDVKRGVAYPNKTTAINLRPFNTYSVRLAQRGTSFVEYDQVERDITLYPGNVVTLDWKAAELNVVFGKIADRNDKPIQNALITGVSGVATTDEFGLFQAEIRADITTITIETSKEKCDIQLPEYSVKQRIGNLGTLNCLLVKK